MRVSDHTYVKNTGMMHRTNCILGTEPRRKHHECTACKMPTWHREISGRTTATLSLQVKREFAKYAKHGTSITNQTHKLPSIIVLNVSLHTSKTQLTPPVWKTWIHPQYLLHGKSTHLT